MDELITKVSDKLSIDEELVRKAVGAVLAFVKKNVGKDIDFNSILRKLEGAQVLIDKATSATKEKDVAAAPAVQQMASSSPVERDSNVVGGSTSGGSPAVDMLFKALSYVLSNGPIMDYIKKIVGMIFGEDAVKMINSAGDGTELINTIKSVGLTPAQGTQMVTMLLDFMKNKVDKETIDLLIEKVPALKIVEGLMKKDS